MSDYLFDGWMPEEEKKPDSGKGLDFFIATPYFLVGIADEMSSEGSTGLQKIADSVHLAPVLLIVGTINYRTRAIRDPGNANLTDMFRVPVAGLAGYNAGILVGKALKTYGPEIAEYIPAVIDSARHLV